MVLHTSSVGVGDPVNQQFLRAVAARHPRIKIILAHSGATTEPRQFLDFMDTGVLDDCPALFLDMSSVSATVVYVRVLERPALHSRLLFASDLPFGLITGVERWSESRGRSSSPATTTPGPTLPCRPSLPRSATA